MRKAFSLKLFIALFALVLGAFLSSCGGGGGSVNPVSQIGGQIVNWNPNAGYTLYAFIGENPYENPPIDSCYGQISVDNQGNFTYTLPTPNASDLSPISFSPPDSNCVRESTPTVSPSDAKFAYLYLMLRNNSVVIGEVELDSGIDPFNSNPPPPSGTPLAGVYIYADRPFTITGISIVKCTYQGPNGPIVYTYKYNYNINAPVGWSYVEYVFKSLSTDQQGNTTYEEDIVSKNSPSSNLSWRIN